MITVVIPFYNSEAYLKRAIDSCLSQKEVSQIVLVDDSSTDNSNVIAREIEARADITIEIFKTIENIGPGPCRNMALDLVKNEYVSFLDSDDYYLQDRFKKSLDLLQNNESIDGVYAPFKQKIEKADLKFQKENFELDVIDGLKINLEDFLLGKKGTVTHLGILFRYSFLNEKNIAYSHDRTGEDLDFLFDSIIKGKIVYQSGIIGVRNITGFNLTNKSESDKIYKVHQRWFKNMMNSNFSKEINFHFFRNVIIKHPMFYGRKGIFWKGLKGIYGCLILLFNPKLWFKLI